MSKRLSPAKTLAATYEDTLVLPAQRSARGQLPLGSTLRHHRHMCLINPPCAQAPAGDGGLQQLQSRGKEGEPSMSWVPQGRRASCRELTLGRQWEEGPGV